MKSLVIAVSLLSVSILICAACGTAAEPLPAPADLLKDYESLGLPLSPKASKLVKFQSGGGGIVNGVLQRNEFSAAFELKAATKTEKPLLLYGTRTLKPDWGPPTQAIEPDLRAFAELDFDSDTALVLSIQSHARGWDKLSQYLLERGCKEAVTPPQKRLVQFAWDYWISQITQPKIDRHPVASRLKDLIRRDPKLDTEYSRSLLKSLDLALVPSQAKLGTLEAWIDALVDYTEDESDMWFDGRAKPGHPYGRIVDFGFDAVPALIGHLDDERLTRVLLPQINNFHPLHLRVRDVVGDILEGLAAEELERGEAGESVGGGSLRRRQGFPIMTDAAKKWWEKARPVGEEAYLLEHVLPKRSDKEKTVFAEQHLLRLIEVKYPHQIPRLYRTVIDKRTDIQSWNILEAIQRSKMPDREKISIFAPVASHEKLDHRMPAMHALKDLDKKQYNALLLKMVEALPNDVTTDYWCSHEGHISQSVLTCDDPRVWAALEKAVGRSSLGMRMELLNHLSYSQDTPWHAERLHLLASFLDDRQLRDRESERRFSGPCAGFNYEKIEVRDFVALVIADILKIKIELKLDRTPEQWSRIRFQIRAALKQELAKLTPH